MLRVKGHPLIHSGMKITSGQAVGRTLGLADAQDPVPAPVFRDVPVRVTREVRIQPGVRGRGVESCGRSREEVWPSVDDAPRAGMSIITSGGTMADLQFTQIGSPKPAVVKASIRELEYQCEIMDRMGLDQDGVMMWVAYSAMRSDR